MLSVSGYMASASPAEGGAFLQRFRTDTDFIEWLAAVAARGVPVVIVRVDRS